MTGFVPIAAAHERSVSAELAAASQQYGSLADPVDPIVIGGTRSGLVGHDLRVDGGYSGGCGVVGALPRLGLWGGGVAGGEGEEVAGRVVGGEGVRSELRERSGLGLDERRGLSLGEVAGECVAHRSR